jgi:hypothetical protein
LKKYLLLALVLLAACTKDNPEIRMAQLTVDGSGTYLITYGTTNQETVKGIDDWTTTFNVKAGDTVQLLVQTGETPATLYMSVEIEDGHLFCNSLYIEPNSTGTLHHIINP